MLIIGAPREIDLPLEGGRKARVCRGPFTPLPEISKDDAHRSLLSKVTPLPSGVRVNPVRCAGGCVVLVDVDSSNYPPHQHDRTYWIRLDGETRKAPHALVESLFLQRRGPNLELNTVISGCRFAESRGPGDYHRRFDLDLRFVLMNNNRNIAEYCAVDLKTDPRMEVVDGNFTSEDPQPEDVFLPIVKDEDGRRLLRYRIRSYVLHAHSWKSLVARFHLAFEFDKGRQVAFVADLQAKDMLRKRYEFEINVSGLQSGQVVQPVRVLTIGSAA